MGQTPSSLPTITQESIKRVVVEDLTPPPCIENQSDLGLVFFRPESRDWRGFRLPGYASPLISINGLEEGGSTGDSVGYWDSNRVLCDPLLISVKLVVTWITGSAGSCHAHRGHHRN